MIISKTQLHAIDEAYQPNRVKVIRSLIFSLFPRGEIGSSDESILQTIETAIADGKTLKIVDNYDIARLAALSLFPDKINDPFNLSVIIRMLNKVHLAAEERLNFIYKNVIESP